MSEKKRLNVTYVKSAEPSQLLTTEEVKTYLKVDASTDDDLIDRLIVSSTQLAEEYCWRSFLTTTWVMYLDQFPSEISILRGPVASITSVKYYDADNTLQTLSSSSYIESLNLIPAVIKTATPPTIYDRKDAVQVTFVAGVASATNVEDAIKQAILFRVAKMYDQRVDAPENFSNMAFYRMLHPYRRWLY